MAGKKNGIHRTVLLTPAQDARLNRLLEATGLNRNAFVRLCVAVLTPDDVEELRKRQ